VITHTAPLGGFRAGDLQVEEWGVTLPFETMRQDGRGTEGALFLFARDRLEDPRAPAYVSGLLSALRTVIDRATPKSVPKWAIGYLDVRMPIDVLEPPATEEAYRDAFLSYPWLGRILPDRPKKAPTYVRAPARAIMRDGAIDLDALYAWVHAHSMWTFDDPKWDAAMLRALPEPVRVLQGLFTIESMVGGNGFEVFLLQAKSAVVRDAYTAVAAAGAEKLRELMAQGIGLAARHGAEFMRERGKKWLEEFEDCSVEDWSEIDGRETDSSFALLESELRPCAMRYAERHRDTLVR
jgi:hypothetical protein